MRGVVGGQVFFLWAVVLRARQEQRNSNHPVDHDDGPRSAWQDRPRYLIQYICTGQAGGLSRKGTDRVRQIGLGQAWVQEKSTHPNHISMASLRFLQKQKFCCQPVRQRTKDSNPVAIFSVCVVVGMKACQHASVASARSRVLTTLPFGRLVCLCPQIKLGVGATVQSARGTCVSFL